MGSIHPYYRRSKPKKQIEADFVSDNSHIDLTKAHLEAYGASDPVNQANELFDKRAAAAVRAAVGTERRVRIYPNVIWKPWNPISPDTIFEWPYTFPVWPFHVDADGVVSKTPGIGLSSAVDLLEMKFYGDAAPTIFIPRAKCLAAMAYLDYFPDSEHKNLPDMVSQAIMAARPGWCGAIGPRGLGSEGNYNMSQMHLLQIAYRYYGELFPEAREHLIRSLLAMGTIRRLGDNVDDIFTSGPVPNDWSRAGHILHIRVGETENHILTMHTARYLTNQLLYQRDHDPEHDNRRNGSEDAPTCTELMLYLLRNILRDDFSEYNAKNYQNETRSALLNLCSYAYDHEVRLAARMVLDYVSAHIAISSNDLRRMVPFRRLNENAKVTQFEGGYMDVGLLELSLGADPTAEHFAILTGNTRAYATGNHRPMPSNSNPARPWNWAIASDGGEATIEALSDYRLPPSIHDLFVNDLNRRFFQRLHRIPQDDPAVTGRNADNMEIYAGSPSYLISAGGSPATYAVDPKVLGITFGDQDQQIGVAVTTSFMPTGQSSGTDTQNNARDLIQFSSFSDLFAGRLIPHFAGVANYGVAPDFACGHQVHLPAWVVESTLMQAVRRLRELEKLPTTESVSVRDLNQRFKPFRPGSVRSILYEMRSIMAKHLEFNRQFYFVDRGSSRPGKTEPAGFYLAIFRDKNFAFLEAFDTWLHPGVTYEQFKDGVLKRNRGIRLQTDVETHYTTQNGNRLRFVIWNDGERDNAKYGAKVLSVEYGENDPTDRLGDAGNITDRFLNGTVLNSPPVGTIETTHPFTGAKIVVNVPPAVIVEITNPFLGSKITLDMSDPWHPKRTSETGEVEAAGSNHEVWVDFAWTGPTEGDFFRPFNRIAAATAAVADGGVIKIMPGSTSERPTINNNKRIRLVAPIGGVTIGVR